MRKKSAQVALCGVLAGLAAALMALGGILPAATYCAPLLASLVLIPAREECGAKAAWLLYVAAALLSLFLCADKEAAVLYVALGYYPLVHKALEAVKPRALVVVCKLALFNIAVCAVYALLLFVLVSEALRAEFHETTRIMQLVLLAAGNLVFLLYDLVLRRLEPLYRVRLQPVLRKLFR